MTQETRSEGWFLGFVKRLVRDFGTAASELAVPSLVTVETAKQCDTVADSPEKGEAVPSREVPTPK